MSKTNYAPTVNLLLLTVFFIGMLLGSPKAIGGEINIYSHRQPYLIEPFLKEFTKRTKIKTNVSPTQNEISPSEKSIREKVQNREKFDIDVIPGGALKSEVLPQLLLFPPIKGEITNKMNISNGHFGVDVIAPKNEAVSSILNGTIVYQIGPQLMVM